MEYGFTPSDVRKRNQLLVLNALRAKPATYLELAGQLNLSTTAINNIINELVERNIIKYSGVLHTNRAGRRANLADINESYGIIALIEFSSTSVNNYFTVSVCDLKEKQLGRELIPSVTGDTVTLNRLLRAALDNLLSGFKEEHGSLLTICIAAPGMVDDDTGELIATCLKRGDGDYNIKEYLERYYHVPVHIRSLLSCSAKAELKKGALSDGCKFGLLCNIDEGIGASFIVNGQTFTGAHGYAGEIGFVKNALTDGAEESLAERAKTGLGSDISIYALMANAERRLALLGENTAGFNLERLFTEYRNRNSVVVEEVILNARKVGAILTNLSMLLDPDHIVLTGCVKNFKEPYLEIVRGILNHVGHKKIDVVFSSQDHAIYDGLIDSAIKIVLDSILRDPPAAE